MECTLGLLTLLATITACLSQQQPQQAPQGGVQGPSAPLLGVRYSAATDVSHISFKSPLVTYGSPLNEIQLPAAPIQPANLKQAPQSEGAPSEQTDATQQGQTLVRSFANQGQTQQLQSSTVASQPQFLSVQQYPANPQLQSTPQGFSLTQNLPGPQVQPQNAARYAPQLPLVQVRQQPQYPQYALPSPQPQQQYVLPQQYATAPQTQYPTTNGYFATGPYAAEYAQPNLVTRQYEAQPQYAQNVIQQYSQPVAAQYPQPVTAQYPQPVATQYPQPVAAQYPQPVPQQYSQTVVPPAQVVSRVAFNGPVGGFSYSF